VAATVVVDKEGVVICLAILPTTTVSAPWETAVAAMPFHKCEVKTIPTSSI
jgi:hypothetical protein